MSLPYFFFSIFREHLSHTSFAGHEKGNKIEKTVKKFRIGNESIYKVSSFLHFTAKKKKGQLNDGPAQRIECTPANSDRTDGEESRDTSTISEGKIGHFKARTAAQAEHNDYEVEVHSL